MAHIHVYIELVSTEKRDGQGASSLDDQKGTFIDTTGGDKVHMFGNVPPQSTAGVLLPHNIAKSESIVCLEVV